MTAILTAMLLADGRFPAGAHAHSAGLEAAAKRGAVTDIASLEAFLRGRLFSTTTVEAATAARTREAVVAARGVDEAAAALHDLDEAIDARTLAPALRATSRRLGRQLLRAARVCWADPMLGVVGSLHDQGAHAPVVWGVVGVAAGLDARDTARVVAHGSVTGPATAAVRLLGLDPFLVHATVVRLTSDIERVVSSIDLDADELPAWSAPMAEIDAQRHAEWEVRLFAS